MKQFLLTIDDDKAGESLKIKDVWDIEYFLMRGMEIWKEENSHLFANLPTVKAEIYEKI